MEKPVKPKSVGPSTAKSYKLIEIYIKIAVTINAVPFHYDKISQTLSLDRNSQKYGIWLVLMMGGMLVELSQVTRELVRAGVDEEVSRGEWSLILFIFLSWWLITLLHYNAYSKGDDMVTYHNQVIGIRKHFGEDKLPPTADHKMVRAHIISSVCQCFFQCLMVAAEGTRSQYIYSNLPPLYRNWLTGLIWAVYAYYRVMSNFLTGYFSVFTGIFHVQTCNQILQYRNTRAESSVESLRSYRWLQILCRQYNTAYATIFLPQITIFASGNIILGLFGTLRFIDTMKPDLYMNFPLMSVMMLLLTFTFYPNNAIVKETSECEPRRVICMAVGWGNPNRGTEPESDIDIPIQLAASEETPSVDPILGGLVIVERNFMSKEDEMRRRINRHRLRLAKCIARTCPFVAVRMGTLYPIKRCTVLTLFNFICCNTISVLLTWK